MTNHDLTKFPIDINEYPQEIAETLIKMLKKEDDISEVEEIAILNNLENAIYHIRTCAENSYNSDYFRILYTALAKITENHSYR